jgi:uncharacterized membrane protein
VSSFQRMTRFEYLTLWLTFAAIMVPLTPCIAWMSGELQADHCSRTVTYLTVFVQATNLELGIAAGLLLSALFFSFQYAR